jgi:hypothetical protein
LPAKRLVLSHETRIFSRPSRNRRWINHGCTRSRERNGSPWCPGRVLQAEGDTRLNRSQQRDFRTEGNKESKDCWPVGAAHPSISKFVKRRATIKQNKFSSFPLLSSVQTLLFAFFCFPTLQEDAGHDRPEQQTYDNFQLGVSSQRGV